FEFGDDHKNTEIRTINFHIETSGKVPKPDRDHECCQRLVDCGYDEYCSGTYTEPSDQNVLVVKVDNYRFLNACPMWYGLNPKIALRLGWKCDNEFPPKWRNSAGKSICYSIGWKNGNWAHRHYSRNDACSEGFAVLIEKNNLKEVVSYLNKKSVPKMFYKTTFERKIYNIRTSQFHSIYDNKKETTKVITLSD
ncbi:MAG: hypothetical protein WC484_07685, partial [Candidatus Omnitrophota bacterium]